MMPTARALVGLAFLLGCFCQASALQQPEAPRSRSRLSQKPGLAYRSNCNATTEMPFYAESFAVLGGTQKTAKPFTAVAHAEVDRSNLHPVFKLDWVPQEVPLGLVAALAITLSPILLPLLPVYVWSRKKRWEQFVDATTRDHYDSFRATTQAYRQSQRRLVDQLMEAQQQQPLSSSSTPQALPRVLAVTMATGQEGQGVVRALAESPWFDQARILALVRNPSSPAARALAQLSDRIELVQCDSTSVESLKQALQPAEAVFLATTLNRASAGHWDMHWNGGEYQIQQGRAFAKACAALPNLQHVVYGTAPLRKWPKGFGVEPPIHYAAKWRVEQILQEANLPVTFLRKCPYHENFTKLTKTTKTNMAAMGVEAGGAFDTTRRVQLPGGHYQIRAFTPPSFAYNMMDPRDTGKWAVLAFSNPSILMGQSFSVASDALTGAEMAQVATDCGALGEDVTFEYSQQPRWLFETLAFVEPTFVYISGLQRWNSDGGQYDLDAEGVQHLRKLEHIQASTWADHLEREGLGQFTETMADLLPDFCKSV